MPEYNVSWTIDSVTADSPEEAAQWCRDMLLDPTNIASFFHVTDEEGNDFEIDTLVPAVKLDEDGLPGATGTAFPEPLEPGTPSDNAELLRRAGRLFGTN
jgi:hypothetical protein